MTHWSSSKEFRIDESHNGYQYGLFYEESEGLYYITDETIDLIVSKAPWVLSSNEVIFIKHWKIFEDIHRQFCLGKLNRQSYNDKIENEYQNFSNTYGYMFGENCDRLINQILRCLK